MNTTKEKIKEKIMDIIQDIGNQEELYAFWSVLTDRVTEMMMEQEIMDSRVKLNDEDPGKITLDIIYKEAYDINSTKLRIHVYLEKPHFAAFDIEELL